MFLRRAAARAPGFLTERVRPKTRVSEGFNDWRGRGYDDFVPGEVTKTALSGDEPT